MARKAAGRKAGSQQQRRARAAARAAGRDDRSDYKNVRRAEKIEAANKKSSCLPKLFMLMLPFAAVGMFLVLRT